MKILPVIHHTNDAISFAQAKLCKEAGADGVFLISHEGENYEVLRVACTVQDELGSATFKVGANLLGWEPHVALHAAGMQNLDMVWLDRAGVSSTGLDRAGKLLLDARSHLAGDEPEIFAGVAFKYQPPELDPTAAADHARAIKVIPTTSGPATGVAPSIAKINGMSRAGAAPLAVASGLTAENVAEFAPFLSHGLVATGVERDGLIDFELLSVFIGRARGAVAG